MARTKSDQEKAQDKLVRQAAAKARREQQERELRDKRALQLRTAEQELMRLDEAVRSAHERKGRHESLSDHLVGFYEEVDKLAKGRSLMEATTLIVEQANDIIRDAKSIITNDAYLDRIKEFVPAGNNPVYPDVLLVARSVQQCLGRTEKLLAEQEKRAIRAQRHGRTIVAALKFFGEHGDEASREEIQASLGAKAPDEWFFEGTDGNFYFDFDRLDEIGVDRSISCLDQGAS